MDGPATHSPLTTTPTGDYLFLLLHTGACGNTAYVAVTTTFAPLSYRSRYHIIITHKSDPKQDPYHAYQSVLQHIDITKYKRAKYGSVDQALDRCAPLWTVYSGITEAVPDGASKRTARRSAAARANTRKTDHVTM